MIRAQILVALVVSLFAWKAYSAVEIEPYVGYELADWDGSDSSYTQLNIGGRLGFSFLFFSLGAEASMGQGDGDVGNSSYDTSETNFGAYAKFTFPILLQAYVTYFASSELELEFANDTNAFTYSGNTMKAGLGFTGLPFLVINFEYLVKNYDEIEYNGTTTSVDGDIEAYAINISLPLDF